MESVESQNRGFDLISRKPHIEYLKAFTGVQFIEVKGRSEVGNIIRNPAKSGWKPIIKIEHYQVGAQEILSAETTGIKNKKEKDW